MKVRLWYSKKIFLFRISNFSKKPARPNHLKRKFVVKL